MNISVVVDRVSSTGTERLYEKLFSKDKLVLGRSAANDIVLAAPDVSGRHAELFLEREGGEPRLLVRDLKSSNGTYLEDAPVGPDEARELSPGARVIIGEFLISAALTPEPTVEVPAAEPPQPESFPEAAAEEQSQPEERAAQPAQSAAPETGVLIETEEPVMPEVPANIDEPVEALQSAGVVHDRGAGTLEDVLGLLEDGECEALYLLGTTMAYEERNGVLTALPFELHDEQVVPEVLRHLIRGSGISAEQLLPAGEALLENGNRLKVFQSGTGIILRKPPRTDRTLDDLRAAGTLTPADTERLNEALRERKNILICGAPRAGKTTLLAALCRQFDSEERVFFTPSAAALAEAAPHGFTLEEESDDHGHTHSSIPELGTFPERVIADECDDEQLLELLIGIHQGLTGVIATVSAASIEAMLCLLELRLSPLLPAAGVRAQLAAAFQLVVELERSSNGVRRVKTMASLP